MIEIGPNLKDFLEGAIDIIAVVAFVIVALMAFEGCTSRRYVYGPSFASVVPDQCDPRGACNVGKRPW